jgi:hypothetical protein
VQQMKTNTIFSNESIHRAFLWEGNIKFKFKQRMPRKQIILILVVKWKKNNGLVRCVIFQLVEKFTGGTIYSLSYLISKGCT